MGPFSLLYAYIFELFSIIRSDVDLVLSIWEAMVHSQVVKLLKQTRRRLFERRFCYRLGMFINEYCEIMDVIFMYFFCLSESLGKWAIAPFAPPPLYTSLAWTL